MLRIMEFLGFIHDAIAKRGDGEARINHHWNTQVPFYFKDRGFNYDHVFHLEKFGDAMEWLCRRYGVETENTHKKNNHS